MGKKIYFILVFIVICFLIQSAYSINYSLNSTNSTLAGSAVQHSLYWESENGLSGYIFSFDNCTGSLVNETSEIINEGSFSQTSTKVLVGTNSTSPDNLNSIDGQTYDISDSLISNGFTYYVNSSDTLMKSASTAYTEYLSLSWTPEAGSKWLVLAYAEGNSSSASYQNNIRILNNTHVLALSQDRPKVANTEILPFMFAIVQHGTGTPVKYNISFASSNTAATAGLIRARLIAIRIDNLPNAHYNYTYTNTLTSNVNNVWGDAAGDTDTITLNVPSDGLYLIMGAAIINSDSTSGPVSYRISIDNGAEYLPYGIGTLAGDYNYSLIADYSTAEAVSWAVFAVRQLSAGTHSIKAQLADTDATASSDWQYRSLIAIRLTDVFDFYNATTIAQASTTSTSFQNYTVLNINDPGSYILLAGITQQGSSTSYDMFSQLSIDGKAYAYIQERPQTTYDYRARFMLQNITLNGGQHYIATQHRVSNAAATSRVKNSDILAIKIPYKYRSEVEHNATINYQGNLQNISVAVNFTTNVNSIFNLSIFNFAYNSWDYSSCSNNYVPANEWQYWTCNITSNALNYVSSGNIVRVNLNSTDHSIPALVREDYVNFKIYSSQQIDNWVPFTSPWSNVTKVINSTVGCTIRWCVYANDSLNNWNGTSCLNPFSYVTVPNVPPTLSSAWSYPASGIAYSAGATYTFNITACDENGNSDISTVLFEWNGLQNYTVEAYKAHNSTCRNYTTAKIDLAANPSGYAYKWYVNDSENKWASFAGTFAISKGVLSGSITSPPVTYPTDLSVSSSETNGGDADVFYQIYCNDTLIASSIGSAPSGSYDFGAGGYACKLNTTSGPFSNWTANSSMDSVLTSVGKGSPVLSLSSFPSWIVRYPAETTVTGSEANEGDADVVYNLYRDDVLVANPETITLGAGTYAYVFNTSGGANWTQGSQQQFLNVLKGYVPLHIAINGSESAQSFVYENVTNATAWSDVVGEDLTFNLYRDSNLVANGMPASETIRLGAGTYAYVFNTSGGANYTSNETSLTLTIYPKTISIYLSLNGTQSNKSYTYPQIINATAWKDSTIGNEGAVSLLRDGMLISSGQTAAEIALLGNGTYNYSATFSASNYSASSITLDRFALVNKGQPPIYLAINGSQSNVSFVYPAASNATGWLETWNNEGQVKLWRDGINIASGTVAKEEMLLGAGEYNYSLTFDETQNYTYASITQDRFLLINKSASKIRLFLNGTEGDRSYNLTQVANFTVALNVSGKTVYLDTNISNWQLQSSQTVLYSYTTLRQKGVFNITGYFLGDQNYTGSSQTYFATVEDVSSPLFAAVGQNSSWVGVNRTIMLFANWTDDYDLDYAWLATNETGTWQNKSFIDINLTGEETWSNFTWQSSSIPAGRIVGWRIYANDSSGNVNATDIMWFAVNASELWRYATAGFIYSSPAVGDVDNDNNIDVVFASYDKKVYVLQGTTGQKMFEFATNNSIASSPSLSSVSGSNYLYIFIGSYDKNMYAINGSDGKKIWNYTTGGLVYSSPALYDINNDGKPEVIFGSYDGNLYALDSETGSKIWNYSTQGKIASSPAVAPYGSDVLIVFGSYDSKLYALNSTGDLLWQFSAADKIESSPAIGDVNNDGIYEIAFGSYDNKTYLVNASNGQQIWSYSTGNWITSSPVIADIGGDKKIIIASHDSNVYSFNPDGSINWTFVIPTGGRIQSSPSIADVDMDGVNDVIVGCSDSRLYALNGLNGKPIWSYKVSAYIFSSPTIADINGDGNQDFLFGSLDKNQYSLDPPSWSLFGGNERRTRIYDTAPPELIYFEAGNDTKQISSLWQEKFSNLAFALIAENSSGIMQQHKIALKGMVDWVNFSYHSGGFGYAITVFDEYGNNNTIEGFVDKERDSMPPIYFGNISASQQYSPGKIYNLFANWTDNEGVDEVLIEHNFTGFVQNISSSAISIADLPAGTYAWRSYAKDYSGNWNKTEQFYLFVEKAASNASLLTVDAVYPSNATAICKGDKLYRNGTIVNLIDYPRLDAGDWNYTCVYEESQNYTASSDQKILHVYKGFSQLYLSVNYTDKCPAKVSVKAYESNEGDSDVIYELSNGTNSFYGNISLSYWLPAGTFNFTYSSSEGKNWSQNAISKQITIKDDTKPVNVYHKITRANNAVTIETAWKDKCSPVTRGMISENSLGFYRNHTVEGVNSFSYAFPEQDLQDTSSCRWIRWIGKLCIKFIDYNFYAFDEFGNQNHVSGRFVYWFFG